MPSHYAHYRFGCLALPHMSPEARRCVQRYRQLYDAGLHGPDPFFYHNILRRDSAAELAHRFHCQSGQEFFGQVCCQLRPEPSDAAMAYLYGVLAHYCLDSLCHPYIHAVTADGAVSHAELETDFDRHLLVLDGEPSPHTFDCSPHMKLTREESATVSVFYPGASPAMVYRSIHGMALCVRYLSSPAGIRRNILNAVLTLTGGKFSRFVMSQSPNPNCTAMHGQLHTLFHQALDTYPAMLEQLQTHMSRNTPLGEAFEKTFG